MAALALSFVFILQHESPTPPAKQVEEKNEAARNRETRYKGMTPELYQATYEKVRTAPSEENSPNFMPTNEWYCVGPFGNKITGSTNKFSGRCTDIELDGVPGGHIRIASAQGGLWEFHLAGSPGTPLSDDISSLEIGSFASHPGNSDRIVIGTGEPVGSGGGYVQGVFKTTNKGANWIPAIFDFPPGAVYKIRYGGLGALYYMAAMNGFYRSDDEGFT